MSQANGGARSAPSSRLATDTKVCAEIPLSLRSRLSRTFDALGFSKFMPGHRYALWLFEEVFGPIAQGEGGRVVIERPDGRRDVVLLPRAATEGAIQPLDEQDAGEPRPSGAPRERRSQGE